MLQKLLISAVVACTLLVTPTQATGGSFYTIDGVFQNDVTKLVSGIAYGTVHNLIKMEADDDCFREMWMFGQKFVSLSRFNRVRTDMDYYFNFPLAMVLLIQQGYTSISTCIELDPNSPLFPYFNWLTQDNPNYNFGFFFKTALTVVDLYLQYSGTFSNFDFFFFGRTITNFLATIGVVSYNIGYYYL